MRKVMLETLSIAELWPQLQTFYWYIRQWLFWAVRGLNTYDSKAGSVGTPTAVFLTGLGMLLEIHTAEFLEGLAKVHSGLGVSRTRCYRLPPGYWFGAINTASSGLQGLLPLETSWASFRFQGGETHGLIVSACCPGGSSLPKLTNYLPCRRRIAGMRQINFMVFPLKSSLPLYSSSSQWQHHEPVCVKMQSKYR